MEVAESTPATKQLTLHDLRVAIEVFGKWHSASPALTKEVRCGVAKAQEQQGNAIKKGPPWLRALSTARAQEWQDTAVELRLPVGLGAPIMARAQMSRNRSQLVASAAKGSEYGQGTGVAQE